ncbi:hypothetical protein [Rubritalea sp.]|uniref:hypothetical protein n=1 Tax=Rubritalea sp. TaxID=2109375 RepID=UPI003EF50787
MNFKQNLIALTMLSIANFSTANPKIATITIDGIEHKINLDTDNKINIGSEEHVINVKLSKYNDFKIDSFSFSYNTNMSYTEDKSDPEVLMWNMDGDNTIIMVQQFDITMTLGILSEAMKAQFESMKADVKTKPSILKCKNHKLNGVKSSIKFGDIYLSQEIYSVKKNGKYTAIIIQDTLNDDRSHTQEYKSCLSLLKDTFTMKQ